MGFGDAFAQVNINDQSQQSQRALEIARLIMEEHRQQFQESQAKWQQEHAQDVSFPDRVKMYEGALGQGLTQGQSMELAGFDDDTKESLTKQGVAAGLKQKLEPWMKNPTGDQPTFNDQDFLNSQSPAWVQKSNTDQANQKLQSSLIADRAMSERQNALNKGETYGSADAIAQSFGLTPEQLKPVQQAGIQAGQAHRNQIQQQVMSGQPWTADPQQLIQQMQQNTPPEALRPFGAEDYATSQSPEFVMAQEKLREKEAADRIRAQAALERAKAYTQSVQDNKELKQGAQALELMGIKNKKDFNDKLLQIRQTHEQNLMTLGSQRAANVTRQNTFGVWRATSSVYTGLRKQESQFMADLDEANAILGPDPANPKAAPSQNVNPSGFKKYQEMVAQRQVATDMLMRLHADPEWQAVMGYNDDTGAHVPGAWEEINSFYRHPGGGTGSFAPGNKPGGAAPATKKAKYRYVPGKGVVPN